MGKHRNTSNATRGGLLAVCVLLAACVLLTGAIPTQAEVIVTATEIDGDVVFDASGTLDLSAWSIEPPSGVFGYIHPSDGKLVIQEEDAVSLDSYGSPASFFAPPNLGSGGNTPATTGSGDGIGIGDRTLWVPAGYISGSPLSGTSTYENHTFASLGLSMGTFRWSWGGQLGVPADSITLNVVVSGPTANFVAQVTEGPAPFTVQFINNSVGATSYDWDFGDGTTTTNELAFHTYNTPGTYTVSLTATGDGGSDTLTRTDYITVTGTAPTVDFAADVTSGTAPLTVRFTNLSVGGDTFVWIFGDSATSTEEDPSHTYSTAGTYTVSLVVTGNDGTDSLTKTDYIVVDEGLVPPTVEVQPHPGIVVYGIVAEQYQVEWQDALVPDSPWQLLEEIPSLLSSPYVVYDPTPISEANQRYYRAVWFQ